MFGSDFESVFAEFEHAPEVAKPVDGDWVAGSSPVSPNCPFHYSSHLKHYCTNCSVYISPQFRTSGSPNFHTHTGAHYFGNSP